MPPRRTRSGAFIGDYVTSSNRNMSTKAQVDDTTFSWPLHSVCEGAVARLTTHAGGCHLFHTVRVTLNFHSNRFSVCTSISRQCMVSVSYTITLSKSASTFSTCNIHVTLHAQYQSNITCNMQWLRSVHNMLVTCICMWDMHGEHACNRASFWICQHVKSF